MSRWLIVFGWITVTLYLGFGGWLRADLTRDITEHLAQNRTAAATTVELDGHTYRSAKAAELAKREEDVPAAFRWFAAIPYVFALGLVSFSFGAVGGVGRLIFRHLKAGVPLAALPIIGLPLLGGIVGVLLLALAYVFPAAITFQKSFEIQPTSIMFLSLLGGLGAEEVVEWIQDRIAGLIKSEPPPAEDGAAGPAAGKRS